MLNRQATEIRAHMSSAATGHNTQAGLELDEILSDRERTAIESACHMSGVEPDTYHRWYQQKNTISAQLAHLDRHALLQAIQDIDRSDYSLVDEKLPSNGGLVIALPHHGHYVFCAIQLMEHIRHLRDVHIFYGDPKSHTGNEMFDALYRRIFDHADCRAHIIHSNARGMATALRALRNGAVVLMMPDVHRHREESYCVPFLDRPLDVMLGTAAMARKTGSRIVPIVSRVDAELRSTAVIGESIEPFKSRALRPSDASDYWTTQDIFHFFESIMGPQIIYWQYMRQHFMRSSRFPFMHPDTFDETWRAFSSDHRTNPQPILTVCLDQ